MRKEKKTQQSKSFLQRNVHLKDQEASDKVIIASLQRELGLAQVIKGSNKRLPAVEKIKGNGKKRWGTIQRAVGLGLK